jgi:uncharacterized protein
VDEVISKIGEGLWNAFLMAWGVWWALVLGFAISAAVQAWIPRRRVEASLGGGAGSVLRATGLGAASSSCSYAAVAIAKSLFAKGASAAAALAFQFASTNLVWELGLVLWLLIGWQFTLAEFVGGLVLVGLMAAALRLFVSPRLEEEARSHAQEADTGHQHHMAAGEGLGWRERLTSASAWSDVAHNFRGDWQMLWKEISLGFVIAGFVGLLGDDAFDALFVDDAPGLAATLANVLVGPLIAVLSFVCSIGNVPLAAVLWSGGMSFAGVIAFIFADLVVLPIVAIYRKYYGLTFALRITALMLVTMVVAALIVSGLFSLAGLVPEARPAREDIFESIGLDYKLVLNALALVVFATLLALTLRRGATDPVCGMTVDRAKALTAEYAGVTYFFCSDHCRQRFEATPERFASGASARSRARPRRRSRNLLRPPSSPRSPARSRRD